MSTYACSTCKTVKAAEEFHRANTTKRGRQTRCKMCTSAAAKQRHRLHYHSRNLGLRQRLARYGLTPAAYYRMLEDQGFCCASCGDDLDLGLATHVDHCHTRGHVRAVLCGRCNTALGQLQNDPARIDALASYARRHTVLHCAAHSE